MRTLQHIIITLICSLILLPVFSCKRHILPAGVPAKIKIVKVMSINVREKPDGESQIVGGAQTGETYTVIDAVPAYYLITLPSGKRGWIYANIQRKWTELVDENQVKILNNGLSVRPKAYELDGPGVGVAAQDYIFDIMDTIYSHYKIQLPNGREGWIYAGKPEDKWVKPSL